MLQGPQSHQSKYNCTRVAALNLAHQSVFLFSHANGENGDLHGVQKVGQLGEFHVSSVQVPLMGFGSAGVLEHMRFGRHDLPTGQQSTTASGVPEIREVHG